MEQTGAPQSILEFLTAQNPVVTYPTPTSTTLSSHPTWLVPRQLRRWDEFSFETLKGIYGGSLMDEARRKGCRLPSYPYIKPSVDCEVNDEGTTAALIGKWNHTIVTASLDLVEKFHPCDWLHRAKKTGEEGEQGNEGDSPTDNEDGKRQLSRRRIKGIRKRKKKPSARLRPDAGGSSSSLANASSTAPLAVEQLPKDYKTASKWNSSIISKLYIDNMGAWRPGVKGRNKVMPIRQIYTYCVNLKCRYGCILSTGEAVIIRIKPRTTRAGPTHVTSPDDRAELERKLKADGLMEYVSVPWENHRSGDPDKHDSLTVNLALWFIHILAGNGHETSWDYDPLLKLNIPPAPAPALPPVAPSPGDTRGSSREPTSLDLGSPSKKRRRGGLDEDPIHLSVAESRLFATQSTDCRTEQNTQSDDGVALLSEGETLDDSQRNESKLDLSADDERTSAKRRRRRHVSRELEAK